MVPYIVEIQGTIKAAITYLEVCYLTSFFSLL